MRIGLLHPGEMGAAIGGLLVERGHEVLWCPLDRSEQSAHRARLAGLTAVEGPPNAAGLADAELILSVCPPHAALEVACALRGTRALVVDANAVSVATAHSVGKLLGEHWVDGGIIGPPPREQGTTRLYLSGPHAGEVAQLFADTRLEAIVLTGPIGAASALKMTYAAWTKGTAALLLGTGAAARAMGVEEVLLAEFRRSQPGLEDRLASAAEAATTKGWRWGGEMREVASTFADAGLPSGFHEAAAELFDRSAHATGPLTGEVISALLDPR